MSKVVQKALRRYGNQVAVVVMIIPFDMQCNKTITKASNSIPGACTTARMALGVSTIDPAKFAHLHDWLMAEGDKPPTPSQAVSRAYEMVGNERLSKLPAEVLNKQLAGYVELFNKIKAQQSPEDSKTFGLPVMLMGDEVLTGMPENGEQRVYRAWEGFLGVTPLGVGGTPLQ
jgi:hypothetical protein